MADTPRSKLSWLRSVKLWTLVLTAAGVIAYSSCGGDEFNLYSSLGAKDLALDNNKDAKIEQAKVLVDERKYDQANSLLDGLMEKESTDSNEAHLLHAAALLGNAGLDVWSIISGILDDTGQKTSRSGGIDTIFDTFSDSVLGTGTERTNKIKALSAAIATLQAAPQPSDKKVSNTACMLAGLLAVPTITDATTAANSVTTALGQIRDAATSNGTVCPNTSALDTALADVVTASANFNLVLTAAASCSFLNLEEAAALMNDVEQSLNRLRSNADKGCELPTCPSSVPDCTNLFPTCVQEILAVGEHPEYEGNGSIESCEIVLNCTDPSQCFN